MLLGDVVEEGVGDELADEAGGSGDEDVHLGKAVGS